MEDHNKPSEPDNSVLLRQTVQFLNQELIECYIIINKLNSRCNKLAGKLKEYNKVFTDQ